MDKKQIKELLEIALEQGGDFAEIYLEQKETTGISYEDGKIDRINAGIDWGIGIRVIVNDNTCYAYSNNLDFDHINVIARTARQADRSQCQQPELDFLS